jgi:TusA-related sulfurtransferase
MRLAVNILRFIGALSSSRIWCIYVSGEVIEVTLDTRGQKCPQPFVEMVKVFMKTTGKVRVRVITDDEACLKFIPDYGRDLDFELVNVEEGQGYYVIVMGRSS